MTDSFYENGYTVVENLGNNTITVTPDGESPITISIPFYSTFGVDFDEAGTFHKYVVTHEVGTTSEMSEAIVWQNLRERAAPEFNNLWSADDPVTNGSTTFVPVLGSVTHYVNPSDQTIVNETVDGHQLYPGYAIRYLYEDGGKYYVTTIGFGNGDFGEQNVKRANTLWGDNVARIRDESIREYNGESGIADRLNRIDPEAGDADATDTDVPFIDAIKALINTAKNMASPLIMDIDGMGGVELTNIASTGAVYWDIDSAKNDGMAEATAWVTGGDGILAIDLNADGMINNSGELFGNQTGYDNGFLTLKSYDTNGDNAITAEDSVFSDLRVWIDNGDAYSETAELHTMDSLLITSINLAYTEVNDTIAGNQILQESTFTINGNTQDIADVYFAYSDLNTAYDSEFEVDVDAIFLPTLRGYGTLPDLSIAMSLDNTDTGNLLGLVDALHDKTFSQIFDSTATTPDSIRDLIFRWADVEGVSEASRGPNVNGQELAFLEKMMGENFLQHGTSPNPYHDAGEELSEAFHIAFNNIYARLVAQSAGGELFDGDWFYNIATDSIEGITGLNQTNLDALETEATGLANTTARQIFWENVVRMVEYTVGTANLSGGELLSLQTAITDSDATLDLEDDILPLLAYDTPTYAAVNGTSGNDTLNGSNSYDTINAYAGDDTITGNYGSDTLIDGGGNDIYQYNTGDGTDLIQESATGGTADKILFGAGIDSGDLTFTRVGSYDLVIDIDNGSSTGQIYIQNQFNGKAVEILDFNGSSTLDLTTQNYTITGTAGNDALLGVQSGGGTADTMHGGAGNDTLNGYAGADTLYGEDGNDKLYGGNDSDVLYGGNGDDYLEGGSGDNDFYDGAGNDRVYGGTGADQYYYTSGHDVYAEVGTGGTDEIILPPGFTSVNTVYYKIGNDLKIVLDANNDITVLGFFSSANNYIETLKFDGGTNVTLSTVSYILQGDETNNTINGSANDDTFYGNGGNDALSGLDGNDTLYGGTGNDTLTGGDGNDYLDGGAGDDVINGNLGDNTVFYVSGHDTLQNMNGTADVLKLAEGWTIDDLEFRREVDSGIYDLIIRINDVNYIEGAGQFGANNLKIETLQFSDLSTVNLLTQQYTTYGNASNNSIAGIDYGGSNNDIIYGLGGSDTLSSGSGNDVLYGGEGNDTLTGGNDNDTLYGEAGDDTLNGNAGNDVFVYGSGLDTIVEASGTDTLRFEGATTINDISVANYSTYHIKVTVNSAVDEITINNFRYNAGYKVETISFGDGFETDLTTYLTWTTGTTGADTLTGTASDNTIIGLAGADTLDGADGADDIHGGAGADVLYGGAGADLLHGGVDDDTLYGQDGLDTLFGGAGADSFVFEMATAFNNLDVVKDFSTAQNDVLDLSDLLSGYNPLSDAITDFVWITESAGNSNVYVDRDGLGGTYSLVAMASLTSTTGLTDEAALVTSGHLLVA